MSWIRNHPRQSVAVAAAIVGVAMVLIAVFAGSSDAASDSASGARDSASGSTIDPLPSSLGTPLPTDGAKTDKDTDAAGSLAQKLKDAQAAGIPGLSGQGGRRGLPEHTLRLRLTSKAPISYVGYIIPTSLDDNYGTDKNVGTSWSLTTTVYANGDYAGLFTQAGLRGEPVTCTITVDGKVTDRRSTKGPYGQLYCQG